LISIKLKSQSRAYGFSKAQSWVQPTIDEDEGRFASDFADVTKLQYRLQGILIKYVVKYPLVGLSVVFVVGMLTWGAFNWSLELTNTESFCISCHAMRDFVYSEYRKTIHYNNPTGVRATCPDCHVPREWVHKVARKISATSELYHWVLGSIDTREKFEARRPFLANQVWTSMKETDSRECRNCHDVESMDHAGQSIEASTMHTLAVGWGETCIDCHKGIAHSLPDDFDENAVMDRLHERIEREKIDCRQCHTEMVAPPKGDDW
jgi:cytochrome c-type protein NapC